VYTSLRVGTDGLVDVLAVSVPYAQQGNVLDLQARSALGLWTAVKATSLPAGGKTTVTVSGTQLKNELIRIVLLPTAQHAGSTSTPIKVPVPT
jgi:hypothetical protein